MCNGADNGMESVTGNGAGNVLVSTGAEAFIYLVDGEIHKVRTKKGYRIKEIDGMVRKGRSKAESLIIRKIEHLGISPKFIRDSLSEYTVVMEYIRGVPLSSLIMQQDFFYLVEKASEAVGVLHSEGVVHGDLTLNNILWLHKVYLIDFGLSKVSQKDEDRAVDLYLFERAIKASSGYDLSAVVEKGYRRTGPISALDRLLSVRKRGRKRELQQVG
ncbi:TP53 regulating kinase [Nematocida sp. LUAm3]|nr:TP53 regulating kinase [Nematocida sp. LUAm3]KAI5175179.1 TP53 regulating kinase [Nematocida sp. LUAm2]KAI5178149.1 TP53 regulating kinase [Nematocida sp. LUAm1]